MSETAQAADDRKCQATTKSGNNPCRAKPLQGQPYCSLHSDPGRASQIAKRPRKGGLRPEDHPPEIPALQTASQIRDFLAQLMADVRTRLVDAKTASTLATLATSQLKAISAAELEERVEKLERKVAENAPAETERRLLTAEEWERLFAPSSDDTFAAPDSALQDLYEAKQSPAKRRAMPEGWSVPERTPQHVVDEDSLPLNLYRSSRG